MAPSPHWVVALVELIYYAPSIIPLAYVFWKHRQAGLGGWLFFILFVGLQCAGSGMIVGAGQDGTPSAISIIIVQIGLSPLILGISGAVHEYAKLSGLVVTDRAQKRVKIVNTVYHLAVITALAIYAVGASDSFKQPPPENAQALYEAGVLLLLLLFIVLFAAFVVIAAKTNGGIRTARPLFWSIAISLLLLSIRIVYSTISAFNTDDPQFNPVTGKIVYQIVLVFLPGALIIAAMVTGGVMTTHVDLPKYSAVPMRGGPTSYKRPSDSSV